MKRVAIVMISVPILGILVSCSFTPLQTTGNTSVASVESQAVDAPIPAITAPRPIIPQSDLGTLVLKTEADEVDVYDEPDGQVTRVINRDEATYASNTLTFNAISPTAEEQAAGIPDGWLKVSLPIETDPSESTGWIHFSVASAIDRDMHSVLIDLSDNVACVATLGIIISTDCVKTSDGAPGTVTPTGQFFVTEKLELVPGTFYGTHQFLLNAYSDAPQELLFGSDRQIAIHGTTDEVLWCVEEQQDCSHGCIRASNQSVAWLYSKIEAGTPVLIQE